MNTWQDIRMVSRDRFSNDLQETLTYDELLKHEFYLILRYFR